MHDPDVVLHPSSDRPRLYPLTSLRFFAALLIFVLHSNNHSIWPDSLFFGFDFSKAVCFFFVLSGFVLSYTYDGKAVNIRTFYRDRLARIWPATVFSTFFVLLILPSSYYLPSPSDSSHIGSVFLSHLFLLQSFIPLPIFFFGLNAVCWSVSVEAFFYLVFPWFNSLNTRSLALLWVFCITLLFLLSLIISSSQILPFSPQTTNTVVWEGLIYINPVMRLPEFLVGIISGKLYLYLRSTELKRTLFSFFHKIKLPVFFAEFTPVFILLFLGFRSPISFLPIPSQLYFNQIYSAICFSIVMIIVSNSAGLLSSFLSLPPLVFLGEISFGLYLFHQPLLIRSAQVSGFSVGNIQILPQSFLQLLFLSIILASLSYLLLEKPCVRVIKNNM